MTNREVGYVCNDCDYSFFYTEDQDERFDGFTSLMGDEWFCPDCKEQNVREKKLPEPIRIEIEYTVKGNFIEHFEVADSEAPLEPQAKDAILKHLKKNIGPVYDCNPDWGTGEYEIDITFISSEGKEEGCDYYVEVPKDRW